MTTNLGDKVKEMRESQNMTQAGLAQLSGLTVTYISKLENGEYTNPTVSTITALAKAFQCSPWELCEDEWNDGLIINEPKVSHKTDALDRDTRELIQCWQHLTAKQKQVLKAMMTEFGGVTTTLKPPKKKASNL